mmetsp:Transcript_4187/g.10591  ORF Transcript_4187/g.10591 Transcript_4187/m.10591 type:complete len:293 (-) Transcript_4187:112-990(-)
MVRIRCPSCTSTWNCRRDFDYSTCVKCNRPLPRDARTSCVVRPAAGSHKERMQERFRALDKSGDCTLDFDEMSSLLRKGNPHLQDFELWYVFERIDKNMDGRIDFEEFYDYLHAPHSDPANEDPNFCSRNGTMGHEWKFGKCSHCGKSEGAHEKDMGARPQTGNCPDGGKCTFKFAKCTKCGRSEFAPMTHSASTERRAGTTQNDRLQKSRSFTAKRVDEDLDLCLKNPDDDSHEFKFGRCRFCGLEEGRIERSKFKMTVSNTSSSLLGACAAGGKCSFKYSKCTKCGESEF